MSSQFRDFLGCVSDETIAESVGSICNLEMRLDALEELLRDAVNFDDVENYRGEIEATFELFYLRFEEILPVTRRRDLWKFALPPLGLNPPIAKPEKPQWPWPVINDVPATGRKMNGSWPDFSALKMFGYTVGKTKGWPKNRRENFLDDFMRLDLPNVVNVAFGNQYGSPMTTTRLRKVANVIASNCQLRVRRDPVTFQHAIADWESDLAFLKTTFYDGAGLKFYPWPDPRDI